MSEPAQVHWVEQTLETLPRLPDRPPQAHKGHFGLVLIVGGSRGMAGAAALAGMAALRAGAGLVRVAVPHECLPTVAALEPSYMTAPLPSDRAGRLALGARDAIVRLAAQASWVALGPGLGRSLGLDALVAWLYVNLPQPMVIDADGLNALSARRAVLDRAGGVRILTPHPGEFARLLDTGPITPDERYAAAVDFAARHRVLLVLKGHRSLVTDGRHRVINPTGNPCMATGGG